MTIFPIIKEKENNDIIVATIDLFLLLFLLFPVGNVLVPPHQSPQMAKISMSSPITLQRNETSRLRIRWPGGLIAVHFPEIVKDGSRCICCSCNWGRSRKRVQYIGESDH